MAFRDVLRTAPRPPAYNIIQQGIEFSNKAEQMCAWPEAWKLLELVMRVSPAERSDSRNSQVRARLSHCEYTRLGKRLVWLLVP
jgi:DNA-binding HxlR family transcriptional regulator